MTIPLARMRRDKNEGEVREYLRAHGYLVFPINGEGVPDLLVWSGRGRRFHLVEVKNPKGKNRRTPAQERWWPVWNHEMAPVHEVRTGEAAVVMIRSYDDAYPCST